MFNGENDNNVKVSLETLKKFVYNNNIRLNLCAHFCLKRLREKQDLVWATLNSWRVLGCVSDLDILYWH